MIDVVVVSKGHWDFVAFHLCNRRFVPRIEPSVGFCDLFDAQGDHVLEVAFGADVGEVVRHGVKVRQRLFSVQKFFRFFSDFHRNASVVREVGSAIATLRKRGEVVNLRSDFVTDVGDSLGLGRSAGQVHGPVGLAVLHRHKSHAAELHHLEDRNLVLHGHTMAQESSFVQKFLRFSSTFFWPGFR